MRQWIILGIVAMLAGVKSSAGQALPTASGPGSYLAGGVSFSRFQSDYGQNYLQGITGYVDLNLTWRFGVEGEARYLIYHQLAQTNQTTYLVGPRISFSPKRFQPYAKFLVGRGIFNYPYGFAQGRYFVMAPGAGADFEVGPLNVRLIDFEYQKWPNFDFGTLSPYGVSVGVSYKFLRGSTRPR